MNPKQNSFSIQSSLAPIEGDNRDERHLVEVVQQCQPEIVHMATQSLVRKSYENPVVTFDTNVMRAVYLLNTFRATECVKVVIKVTSDKCYEYQERTRGYREDDPFGGYDSFRARTQGVNNQEVKMQAP